MGPDRELLAQYYSSAADTSVPDLVDGFDALNAALETHLDRHHTIGHAFFMQPNFDVGTLRRVWQRRVFPLVEEYFFDQPELAKEFTLERFWPSAGDGR
jgi:5-methylcytosine-specific restriction protein B